MLPGKTFPARSRSRTWAGALTCLKQVGFSFDAVFFILSPLYLLFAVCLLCCSLLIDVDVKDVEESANLILGLEGAKEYHELVKRLDGSRSNMVFEYFEQNVLQKIQDNFSFLIMEKDLCDDRPQIFRVNPNPSL